MIASSKGESGQPGHGRKSGQKPPELAAQGVAAPVFSPYVR